MSVMVIAAMAAVILVMLHRPLRRRLRPLVSLDLNLNTDAEMHAL
jgi:hypothetical protein